MRKFAIALIIILGVIIIWPKNIIDPIPCPCDKDEYYFKKKDSIKKIDEVSEYIPQTIIRSEEYIPQSQRILV